jgi:hypothetical protein
MHYLFFFKKNHRRVLFFLIGKVLAHPARASDFFLPFIIFVNLN